MLFLANAVMNATRDCRDAWPPSYMSLLSTIIAAVFCLVITTGNFMVIVAVVVNPLKKLRSPFNYFVVNLAVADLLVGAVNMPSGIYYHYQEYLMKKPAVRLVEKLFHMSLHVSLIASLFSIITLSIDRYIAIAFAMKRQIKFTWKKCWIISFIIWILSLSVPFFYLKAGVIGFLMVFINTAVAIAAITLIITYIYINKFLKAQAIKRKEMTRTRTTETQMVKAKKKFQQAKVTRIYLWVLTVFLTCYFPAAIVVYILQFCSKCDCSFIHVMRDIAFYLITLNSCMNPFVYAFTSKHYRHALRKLLNRSRSRKVFPEKCVRRKNASSSQI